jgi:hypothetical protein
MEEKFCCSCGAENVRRIEKIAKINAKRKRIEEKREDIKKYVAKKKTVTRESKAELQNLKLTRKSRKLRMQATKLETGDTREGKLIWIQEQIYTLNRSIQEVADDLGESMIKIRKYLDEPNERR